MEAFEDDVSLSPTSPRAEVKTETKAEPQDDDVYEDSLDLDTSQQHQRVMLVRLPEYLMEKLRYNGSELSGADLGKVLIPQGAEADPKQLRVLLNSQIELLRPLPHRYNMTVQHADVENVYIMREQDVKRRRPEEEGGGVRKSKRTALMGHAVNECSLTADMSDPNYNYVLQRRKLMEMPSVDHQTTLLDSMAGVGGAKYGATLRQSKEAWRKPVQRRQLARQAAEGKAIRMPRNELLDLLFRVFEEQPYWTMKDLRERTHQPEAYLRSVLDSIAVLNKRGPYAMKYGLKEEYKVLQSSGASVESLVERAPAQPDEDSDMEMENVEIL